ncbi:MAG TPA: hypothetical protein PLO52_00445 [Flavobacterium alvei]|nr:hypothetical protein [Flavobacterium alvei]
MKKDIKIDRITNGTELKQWRLAQRQENGKKLSRLKFCSVMNKSITWVTDVENKGKLLDENFLIVLKAKYASNKKAASFGLPTAS